MPENEEAAMIYSMVRGQVITRGVDGTVIDINHLAIDAAIDRNGIEDRKKTFDKVVRIFHHFLQEGEDAS